MARPIGDFDYSLRLVGRLTVAQWVKALQAVEPMMSAAQRRMLIAHASAPGLTLSMLSIAVAGGYATHSAANSQYGKLGADFAMELGPISFEQWTQAIAYSAPERDDLGHFQWTMRRNLALALVQLGWVSTADSGSTRSAFEAAAAANEVARESRRHPLPETERQALVDARIGQGKYRSDLMRIWGGRCALTGSSVQPALVASHILAWQDATNAQRLDPYNGLLLAAQVDKLFDRGLISFDGAGRLLRARSISLADLRSLGIGPNARLRALRAEHKAYLALHRSKNGFALA